MYSGEAAETEDAIAAAFESADCIVEGEYTTGAQEQLYIEPNGVIAECDLDHATGRVRGVTVRGSMQCPYYLVHALTLVFNLPEEKCRVIQVETGGAFGGKEDFPSVIGSHAALLAMKSGHPVKIIYDRGEDMAATTKRHPSRTRHRTAVSRDGKQLAYVATNDGVGHLHVRDASADDHDRDIASARGLAHPSWSPDGSRLSYTAAAPRPAVYVTSVGGDYTNLISAKDAESAWSPDGAHLTLVEQPGADVSYNGDPNRLGDRNAYDAFSAGHIWTVNAPLPPDAGLASVPPAPVDRAAQNAEVFDRFVARQDALYYADSVAAPRRAAWHALVPRFRDRAVAAINDDALRTVMHEMLEARPPLRQSATGRAAVSSASPVATAAGLEILRMGGNVVDAAVAVSFALAVAEPDASGPGGYGQMLVYRRGMTEPHLIEFMTRVPEAASLENMPHLPEERPALTNVPGIVAGMYHAWEQFGSKKLPWSALLAPAIRAATRSSPSAATWL